jgi:antitoxin HicB
MLRYPMKLTKPELSRRLKWHLPQVDRVLNVRHASRLDSLEEALAAVKRRMTIQIEKYA